jgi:hypothetical protein
MRIVQEALTFDDVLLLPAYSAVLPKEVSLKTQLTRAITLNIPLRVGRDGYRHRVAAGHCLGAGGWHRHYP